MAKGKDDDATVWLTCPHCGKSVDPGEHLKREDVERLVRILDYGYEFLAHQDEAAPAAEEEPSPHLAHIVRPRCSLRDVVLSERNREQVEDALVEFRNKRLLFDRWGLRKVVRKRTGLSLLFTGPPGTGKTMTAEALAKELGKPLMIVNYAQLENMWVGETEKNIEKVFQEAAARDAVLFFDEADAAFYRRGPFQASWANRDVNVVLQHLETFPGVCILATNLARALDKAVERRLDIVVEFDFPDATMREQIYRRLVPRRAPRAKDVSFRELAQKYPLSGGSILNVVRQAMRYAARRPASKRHLTMEDFRRAAEREVGKGASLQRDHLYGVVLPERQNRLGGYA